MNSEKEASPSKVLDSLNSNAKSHPESEEDSESGRVDKTKQSFQEFVDMWIQLKRITQEQINNRFKERGLY